MAVQINANFHILRHVILLKIYNKQLNQQNQLSMKQVILFLILNYFLYF